MNELDYLPQYVESAKESSDRSRHILLVMVVASILMFGAFWNSRQTGWGRSRLNYARAVEDIVTHENQRRDWDLKRWPDELKIPHEDKEIYANARERLAESPRTLHEAETAFFWSQQIRAEQLGRIQIPVLGISIDVNDLGMLGGISLIVLLVWANYSLWHHHNNLRLALDFAEKVGAGELDEQHKNRLLYHTYQNLATRQVLTIPPRPKSLRIGEPSRLRSGLRKVSKALYALPFFVQLCVVWHDWGTRNIGWGINPSATKIVLFSGTLGLVIIAILTVMCFLLWIKIGKKWRTVAQDI